MTPPSQQTSSLAKKTVKSKPPAPKTGATPECFNCVCRGHLKHDCPYPSPARAKSKGKSSQAKPSTGSVSTVNEDLAQEENSLDFLHSDSDDQTCLIQIEDRGSSVKHASVVMQGVPCEGVINTSSDIQIMGEKRITAIQRRDFRPANKTPVAYGRQRFNLHGN